MLLKIEFGKIVLKKGALEHHLFMKKDKLAHETILLDVVNFMLHHLAHAKFVKNSWDNLCATFDKNYVGNKLNYVKSFTILKWKKAP